ncbi:O-antigen ligase family protein [Hwangdonia lutea]|uniref:O-antigen ligase family protein n=1 Tax=Hwangdonia lutea TaxID=3075823 RepID=A0AA97EPP4_9FLAO|nr:O-antigen ligase family protein [Hwangdonia sp. SCSIO 19198]WOD43960.1 O-antigen ligase family protein [Hwangdonia sp. SCSIO 19198]
MKQYSYITLMLFHLALGVGIFIFKPLSKVYFIAILAICLYSIVNASAKKRFIYVLGSCAYVVGAEVFLRMTGGNLLYEASKYFVILFVLLGMSLGDGVSKKSYIYIMYIFALIPGVIVAVYTLGFETNIRTAIAFNLSGPVCLGIVAVYCYKRNVSIVVLQNILLATILPIITTTTYLFLYSPSIKSVLSGTGSNFAASGGFGPNQVATILGLGAFLLAARLFLQSKTLFLKVLNISILALMTYRAIITFSRGGVFVAVVAILVFIAVFYFKATSKTKLRITFTLLIFGLGIMSTWFISSFSTEGLIDKRYSNQDALGREKEDITTGRTGLLANELNEFFENPFLGVGVGKLKELRFEKEGIQAASHNEMSRIVGEHGFFGVVAFSILLLTPLFLRFKNKKNIYFYSFYLFWFLTINHSSMRIAAPAFIYGLCLLNIQYEKRTNQRSASIKIHHRE